MGLRDPRLRPLLPDRAAPRRWAQRIACSAACFWSRSSVPTIPFTAQFPRARSAACHDLPAERLPGRQLRHISRGTGPDQAGARRADDHLHRRRRRRRAHRPPARRRTQPAPDTLAPVLGAAALRFVAAIVYVVLRRARQVEEDRDEIAVFVALLTVPLTAVGLLLGLPQWRVYSSSALRRLTTGLVETHDATQLRDLLAESLEEPQANTTPTREPGSGDPSVA